MLYLGPAVGCWEGNIEEQSQARSDPTPRASGTEQAKGCTCNGAEAVAGESCLGNGATLTAKCREHVTPACRVQPIKLKVRDEGWRGNPVKLVPDKRYISI